MLILLDFDMSLYMYIAFHLHFNKVHVQKSQTKRPFKGAGS